MQIYFRFFGLMVIYLASIVTPADGWVIENLLNITTSNISEITELLAITHEHATSADWTYDGQFLVVRDWDGVWVYTLDSLDNPIQLMEAEFTLDVIISMDSHHVAIGTRNLVTVWDIENQEEVLSLEGDIIIPLGLTETTLYLKETTFQHRVLQTYSLNSSQLINSLDLPAMFGDNLLDVHLDIKQGRMFLFDIHHVKVVSIDTLDIIHTFDTPEFVDLDSTLPKFHDFHIGSVDKLATSQDGNVFYVLFWNENGAAAEYHEVYFSVQKFDTETDTVTALYSAINDDRSYNYISGISVDTTGGIFSIMQPSSISFTHSFDNENLKTLHFCMDETQCIGGFSIRTDDVAFHPDGNLIATVSSDGYLRLWGIEE